jgi:hypothetical protein
LTIRALPVSHYPHGYPQQAAFQSEHSFSIYRGFSYLHARVILQLQDEIRVLEQDLEDLDELDAANGRGRLLQSRMADLREAKRAGQPSQRAKLLAETHDLLVKYDDLLMKTRELNSCQRPRDRDYRGLRRWFWNEKPLSYVQEEEFIKRHDDLVALRPSVEWGRLDGWIEDGVQRLPRPLGMVIKSSLILFVALADTTSDYLQHPNFVERNMTAAYITIRHLGLQR